MPPAFWFGFEVPYAKILVGRVLLFALLAADALLAVRHAPRYGAGGFNVGQFAFLDTLGPGRAAYAICQLVLAHLFILAACGVATRYVLPAATAIYAWLYFGSQLDSYQHHYLVVMLLAISCAIPWERPPEATPATPVRSWALRLFLVQLAILYLWAAISKFAPAWLDGQALAVQLQGAPTLRAIIESTIGVSAVAKLVIATELGLAATIWWRRAWPFVAPIGILFHLGIVLAKFDIGLFAWLMIGIYAFAIPDGLWVAILERFPQPKAKNQRAFVVTAVFVIIALVLAKVSRLPFMLSVGTTAVVVVVVVAFGARRHLAAATAMLVAALLATVVDRGSDVAVDYYRFWGGSSRRLGDLAAAESAYGELIGIAPDEPAGHYQLGKLLLDRPADAPRGVDHLRTAQQLEPARARAYLAEAEWLAKQGKRDEAIAKAREATYAEPSSSEARALLERLTALPEKSP